MIKDLPELWAVWCPTEEVKNMVQEKLERCGYARSLVGRPSPCFIINVLIDFSEGGVYGDATDLDRLPGVEICAYKEITLRQILEGEVLEEDKEEEEELVNDENFERKIIDAGANYFWDSSSTLCFANIIMSECEKRFVKK